MKISYIPAILVSGLALSSSVHSLHAQSVVKAPSGSIILAPGSNLNYGQKPKIKITLTAQIAREVIGIGGEVGETPDEDDSTLYIAQDSQFTINVLTANTGNKAKFNLWQASALVNAPENIQTPLATDGDERSRLFFKGSETILKNEKNGVIPNYSKIPTYKDSDGEDLKMIEIECLSKYYEAADTSGLWPTDGKYNGRGINKWKITDYDPNGYADPLVLNLKSGDTLDFHVELHSGSQGLLRMDTRLRAKEENRDWDEDKILETNNKQRQIVSLFDGDPIPMNKPVPGQESIFDLLDEYTRRRTDENGNYLDADGNIVDDRDKAQALANLGSDQLINLVDQNYKYGGGNPSSVYDLQDFVFLVSVKGQSELNMSKFDYYLVKTDIAAPTIVYQKDEDGNYVLDGDGQKIPLVDDFGRFVDEEGKLLNIRGEDVQSDGVELGGKRFDEIIKINPDLYDSESDTFAPDQEYQFNTPNGIYGSTYRLVFIPKEDIYIVVGGTLKDNGEIEGGERILVEGGKFFEMDEKVLGSTPQNRVFKISGLKDPIGPVDANGAPRSTSDPLYSPFYRMIADPDETFTVDYAFNLSSSVTTEKMVPRGAYSRLLEHRKFTYLTDSNSSDIDDNEYRKEVMSPENNNTFLKGGLDYNFEQVGQLKGCEEDASSSLVKEISLANVSAPLDFTDPNTNEKFKFFSAKSSLINPPLIREKIESDPTKSGEEHFTSYIWVVTAKDEDGAPVAYKKALPLDYLDARQMIRTYAPPIGQLELQGPNYPEPGFEKYSQSIPVLRGYPSYKAKVKNIYPNAKVYVRFRHLGTQPNGSDANSEDKALLMAETVADPATGQLSEIEGDYTVDRTNTQSGNVDSNSGIVNNFDDDYKDPSNADVAPGRKDEIQISSMPYRLTNQAVYYNGNDLNLIETFSAKEGPALGENIPDGPMILELVHEIDYNGDGVYDDIRVLDSKRWKLLRRIEIHGGLNSSQ